ncbi:integrase [Devosia subaequoris]|uniref:Integrase n=1 Tax=Devosia subaequoris TaxID=395930 RepID=A0A7W6IRC5_9HYPH|nr:site-specific integrase [Devosia subaequoris]MBB4053680.1 integrase [Devosia subaequoris]MCP1211118.1 site-specific integrase [Devosia subaequoris]
MFLSTKNPNPFAVVSVRFLKGERFPFLVRKETGLPLEGPTFWSLALRRAQNLQSSTIENDLRSLMFLFLWAELRGVSVEGRLAEGTFFSLTEIIDISNVIGRYRQGVLAELATNVVKLPSDQALGVDVDERRNRLSAAYSFIEFTSADIQSQLSPWPQRAKRYASARNDCLGLLRGYVTSVGSRRKNGAGEREGMERAAVVQLRRVIEPQHPDNPFRADVRFRNYVIVRLLLDLGIRRGELLGIRVDDLELGSNGTVMVHRRPDDPLDPRTRKPNTKTESRLLALNGRLVELVHEYVLRHRSALPAARRHPFLIVNSVDGAPLSLSAVNKIFEALRERIPDLPDDLSPHVLRHTWNDAFSEHADLNRIPAEHEVKWRARLMGWRNENSAQHYLKRTVRRRSNEELRVMQDGFDIKGGDQKNDYS